MSTANRTAGVAGSITLTTRNTAGQLVTPVSTPTVTWYTDSARTLGPVVLSVTGSGSTYTASWTAAQAPTTPSNRYLAIVIEISAGVFDVDADDSITFVDASVEVDEGYVTLAEIRAMPNLSNATTFPDSKLIAARDWFEATFEDFTGVAWVPRTTTERLNGSGSTSLILGHVFPRSITSVTVTASGVATAFTAAEVADLVAYDTGEVMRLTLGTWRAGNRNVSITYTHGFNSPPADVKEAALVAISDRLLNPNPNRQFSVATEAGVVRNATPGPRSPFGIQFVDEVAVRRSHRLPGVA